MNPGTSQRVIPVSAVPGSRKRAALAEFLRSRRERLTPKAVGLPELGRRRTPAYAAKKSRSSPA